MPLEIPSSPPAGDPIRVMIVDDSAVIRSFLSRYIGSDSAIKVVTSAANGLIALSCLRRTPVDVIVLDIEMPVMDGITALPQILAIDPHVQVIIASTLTKKNAAITLKAFESGAAECLTKPTSQEMSKSNFFRDELVEKVKVLGLVARRKKALSKKALPLAAMGAALPSARTPDITVAPLKKFTLRSEIMKVSPDVIAIGSSTGGPQALQKFFTDLKGGIRQPVFITQHMPAVFTTILAEHISKQSGLTCREAVEGDVVQDEHIYMAPGNFHMIVNAVGAKKIISLNQEPPENFCRPSVDPMMKSLAAAYGRKVLGVIFTGMGSDGLKGCQSIVEAGGAVLAQDEASSVVWGMPGAVAMTGICTQVLPLGQMARAVREYAECRRIT